MQKLEPCPFCAKPLTVRNGVNPYGRCDTEGCWMAEAKIGISCDDPKQVERWNTRPAPAATDTGLVTVAHQYRWGGDPKWKPFGPIFADEPRETRALCVRSQADELLAAERAEKEKIEAAWLEAEGIISDLKAELAEALRGNRYAQLERIAVQRAEKAEADNAELTARVKELDRCHEGTIDLCNHKTAQIEALEAKLSAAEKALEGLREKGRKVLDVLKAWEDDSDLVNSGKIVSDFRAVLGGEPS